MITVRAMLMSEQVLHDVDTQRMSLIGVIDGMAVKQSPIFLPSLCVFAVLERKPQDAQTITCELGIDLDGESLGKFPITIEFQDNLVNRTTLRLLGFLIPRPGRVQARLTSDDQVLGEYGFEVRAGQPQPELKQG